MSMRHAAPKTGRCLAPMILEWVFAAAVVLAAFLIFYYTDFSDTLDNSVMLAEAIVNGEFEDYYRYAAVNRHPHTVYAANYNVFLYGLFALWNLPTVILHLMTGLDYMTSGWALLWCKGLMLTALAATALAAGKAVRTAGGSPGAAHAARLLFLAGPCAVFPATVAGQYDIVALLLMMWGLIAYMKKKRTAFLLCFVAAVPLKLFALFVFVPLLLLREKRPLRFLLQLAAVFAVPLLCALPFRGDPWYEMSMASQSRDALNILLSANVSLSGLPVNLFAPCYGALCLLCLLTRETEDRPLLPAWCCFAAMAAFLVCCNTRSYWVILMAPFALTLICGSERHQRAGVLLFLTGGACYTVFSLMNHLPTSTPGIATTLLIRKLPLVLPPADQLKYPTVQAFFAAHDLMRFSPVLRGVFAACMGLITLLLFPRRQGTHEAQHTQRAPGGAAIWLQTAMTAALMGLLVYTALVPAAPIAYTAKGPTAPLEADVLQGQVIEQTFTPQGEGPFTLEELTFTASNADAQRSSRNAVTFTLTDGDTGEQLLTQTLGTALIANGEVTRLPLQSCTLLPGHTYRLTVTGETCSAPAPLLFAAAREAAPGCALTVDGESREGQLAVTLR